MKKIIALILVALLSLSCIAFADGTTATKESNLITVSVGKYTVDGKGGETDGTTGFTFKPMRGTADLDGETTATWVVTGGTCEKRTEGTVLVLTPTADQVVAAGGELSVTATVTVKKNGVESVVTVEPTFTLSEENEKNVILSKVTVTIAWAEEYGLVFPGDKITANSNIAIEEGYPIEAKSAKWTASGATQTDVDGQDLLKAATFIVNDGAEEVKVTQTVTFGYKTGEIIPVEE